MSGSAPLALSALPSLSLDGLSSHCGPPLQLLSLAALRQAAVPGAVLQAVLLCRHAGRCLPVHCHRCSGLLLLLLVPLHVL
jgi:hypothetical protein